MSRRSLLVLAVSTIVATSAAPPCPAAGPAREVTIENVRVGFASGASGIYKVGTWTPVWIDLKAGPSRFEGVLELTAPDDNGTPTVIRRAVNVAANDLATVAMFVRPGARSSELNLKARAEGRIKAEWVSGTVDSVGGDTGIVVAAGQPVGLSEIADLPKYVANPGAIGGAVLVTTLRPRDGFPSRWYGFDAADAVVLDTNDADTMARVANQSRALREWVRQGGHLVISVGQNWQAVKDSPLEPLLPGVPAGRIELTDPGLIDQFAGTGNKPIIPADSRTKLLVTKFEDWESRGGIPLASSSLTPLVLRGPHGFGRVTIVGLDVDQKPFASWDDKKLFWDKVLDLRGRGGEADATPVYRVAGSDLSAALNASLQRFPGVRLVPFGWVAFFVFLYILLIGPGDYLFLRKVVKRMEYTWITFPLIVLTVSGVAYAAAYYLKGTELRINKVDAVDVDQADGLVRGTTWLTLFSPQNRDYDLGITPLPPEAEPATDPLAPADAKPPVAVETITSWFGNPDSPFGGGGQMSLGVGGYGYAPMSEPEEVRGVRVPIWSTKSFTGRWSAPAGEPLIASDLVPDGPDRVRGTLTNTSKRVMKNAVLFFGRYVYLVGDLAPGASATLGEAQTLPSYMDGVTRTTASSSVNYYNGQPVAQGDDASAEAERPDLVRSILFHDGLGSKGEAIPNVALKSLDLTAQLDLRRPMLVSEIDGPAAQMRLSGNSNPPKVIQTTLLRVILKLSEDPGGVSR